MKEKYGNVRKSAVIKYIGRTEEGIIIARDYHKEGIIIAKIVPAYKEEVNCSELLARLHILEWLFISKQMIKESGNLTCVYYWL